jgi:hypothetical protein
MSSLDEVASGLWRFTATRNGLPPTMTAYVLRDGEDTILVDPLVTGETEPLLAALDEIEHRPERAVQIAAAAEVYAREEGIVNVYSDETPGREFVDAARGALSADDVARATEIGRRLTIKEALDLTRIPETASV